MPGKFLHLSEAPIRLNSTRAWRPYLGGKRLEEWQDAPNPEDGRYPEEWVASTIRARNVGRESIVEGLTTVSLDDGTVLLREVIESDPDAFLGVTHVKKHGASTAILTKLLDSRSRLPIQVHPDRNFAAKMFHSTYGKTEAWYILANRCIEGVDPYLLLGFRPGITRKRWVELFATQNIEGMVDCLHRLPAVPGELLLIEGGVPHAIGPGCFLIEIQEPTDYTIRVERTLPWGESVPDVHSHQGLGFDAMFDCFHYDAHPREEILRRWRIVPKALREEAGGGEVELIGAPQTDKFRLVKLDVTGQFDLPGEEVFSVLIVLRGTGRLAYGNRRIEVVKADKFFLPARLGNFHIEARERLSLIRCCPPR